MAEERHADGGSHAAMPRHAHGFTDFSAHSHQELYSMLSAGDPASIREAAAAWQSTGRMLAEQAQQLKHQLVGFQQMWQGAAADEYKVMITDLANGLDKVGTGALAMNDLMSSSAEALDKARAAMPPPQAVPDLDPQVMATATAPPPAEIAMQPAAQAQYAANQQQAQQAVQAHQAQVDAARGSQTQAVQVMQALASDYGHAEDSVPAAPESVATGPNSMTAADAGGVNLSGLQTTGFTGIPGVSATALPGGAALPTDSTGQLIGSGAAPSASVPNSPLFGHMFTAGLAAASAAATGRFGSVMPRLPSFLNPKTARSAKAEANASAAAAAARAAAARASVPKLPTGGGLGGGGLGGGGFGGGGAGVSAPAATAYPGLIGGSGGAGGAAGAAAGQLAGAAAGAPGASGSSAMPMMPMGGMAGAGAGDLGGKRIPPWLVETEDVWGESSAVSPPVIGEEF